MENKEEEKPPLSPIKAWMSAIRLRTIPIPTIQVLTGTALAFAYLDHVDWFPALLAWLIAVSITFGTNLINDVYDFEKGGDKPDRAGHMKVITAGLISKKWLYAAGIAFFAFAVVLSIPLAWYAGWWIVFVVALSAAIGYCYTGGPYPICYLGLSEIFILFFYGFVCVGASFYVQTHYTTGLLWLCAFQMGLLAILPNVLNNFRDAKDDEQVSKMTLAVRLGETFARWEIALLTAIPFFLNIFWLSHGYPEAAFLPFLLLPAAFYFVKGVWTTPPGPRLHPLFPMSVLIHFGFGLLLTIGFLLEI